MRNILSGARGMAGLVLVILIAWALLSVIFLTGTLLAARSIDRSVNTVKTGINPVVESIGTDARYIDQARKIAGVSGQILTAAKPLSGQLDTIEKVARTGIDPKLKHILGQVGAINEVAGSINSNVLQIGSTVTAILGNASSINSDVFSINHKGRTILRSARQINGSARSILGSGGSILSLVQVIDTKVARANSQASSIKDDTAVIDPNVAAILANVGHAGVAGHGATIHGHANAIDCSTLLNGTLTGLAQPVVDLLTSVLATLGLVPADVPGSPAAGNQCGK
ncbi:MAG: hypothetical protein QOG15_2525 [Solirubrobacteraceae bacterium]|jgi:hypothetical protein|nr:hypothetical protein [Solirubrobacteraceae bacterium]